MTTPPAVITTAEFRAMGNASPKPAKRERLPGRGLKRTGFKAKRRASELPVAVLRRLAEQGAIDPAEHGLNRPRRRPVRRLKDSEGTLTHLVDQRGRQWAWPQPEHMTEAAFDDTLLDWGFKLGGMLKAWHCRVPQESLEGWVDWVYLFRGRGVFSENKVRDRHGDAPPPSKFQNAFISCLLLAGFDARQWTYPDDVWEAWETLTRRPAEECPYWAETEPK
jgi:hypothetical protein